MLPVTSLSGGNDFLTTFFHRLFPINVSFTTSSARLTEASAGPVELELTASTANNQEGCYHVHFDYPYIRSTCKPARAAKYDRQPGDDAAAPRHRQEGQLGSRQSDELLHRRGPLVARRRTDQPARLDDQRREHHQGGRQRPDLDHHDHPVDASDDHPGPAGRLLAERILRTRRHNYRHEQPED